MNRNLLNFYPASPSAALRFDLTGTRRLMLFLVIASVVLLAAFAMLFPESAFAQAIPKPTIPGGGDATDPWTGIKNLAINVAKILLWFLLIAAFIVGGWVVITAFVKAVRDRDIGGVVLYFFLAMIVVLMVWFLVFMGDDILTKFSGGTTPAP